MKYKTYILDDLFIIICANKKFEFFKNVLYFKIIAIKNNHQKFQILYNFSKKKSTFRYEWLCLNLSNRYFSIPKELQFPMIKM